MFVQGLIIIRLLFRHHISYSPDPVSGGRVALPFPHVPLAHIRTHVAYSVRPSNPCTPSAYGPLAYMYNQTRWWKCSIERRQQGRNDIVELIFTARKSTSRSWTKRTRISSS
ncbi:hypothetical protein Pcinc_029212 [Petrolisthes cinctipes]|uniref:Uncharacterized protein n=1 Tax=Petrolisthes cinctipes TaxID=88211 RepID=A0AAE1F0J3_PETCI|nr:hypothetical protein Pcinc_029212 [Petrolisthes cinctipes]